MAYDIAQLEELAHDDDFVQQVRTLVRHLIAADPANTSRLLPLRGYGPAYPGVLLRLDPRLPLDLSKVEPQNLTDLFDVQDRLLAAAV